METSAIYSRRLEPGEIRVLRARASNITIQDLQFELNIVKLADKPYYHALSYTWGNPERCTWIFINQQAAAITESLHDALCELWRHRPRLIRHGKDSELFGQIWRNGFWTRFSLVLWIDAICINQQDSAEVNQQVQLMGSVYQNAMSVPIFLGAVAPGHERDLTDMTTGLQKVVAEKSIGIAERVKDYYPCTLHIATRPWFYRVWTLQEAGLAACAELIYGEHSVPLQSLEALYWLIATNSVELQAHGADGKLLSLFVGSLDPIVSLKSMVSRRKDIPEPFPLFRELMKMGRRRLSQDPRDHVYGLMGSCVLLTAEGSTFHPPQVDYEKPYAELYGEVFRVLLLHPEDAGLNILVTEVRGVESDSGPGVPDLPSWVPDYSLPYPFLSASYDLKTYHAGGHQKYPLVPSCFTNNGTWLELRGVRLDEVVLISDPGSVLLCTLDSEMFPDLDRAIVSITTPALTSETERLWACRRTLCLDFVFRLPAMLDQKERVRNRQAMATERLGSSEAARTAFELAWNTRFEPRPRRPGDLHSMCVMNVDENGKLLSEMFVVLASGRTAMCRPRTLVGDLVVVSPGVCMPFILRKRQGCDRYRMIGPAYVDGVMDGEVIEAMERGENELETFVID